MSPKKLTEDDKQEILDLYRQTPETTSTLAERFGVSSSTISRFLKMSLSENEYEVLIQQKRLARVSKADSQLSLSLENAESTDSLAESSAIATDTLPTTAPLKIIEIVKSSPPEQEETVTEETPIRVKTRKRRSTAKEIEPVLATEAVSEIISETIEVDPVIPVTESDTPGEKKISQKIILKSEATIAENYASKPIALDASDLGELVEELGKLPKIQPELEDEDLDDELDLEDDDDEEEDDWQEEEEASFFPSLIGSGDLTVLPLSAAVFPTTCYLVVDRTAELIVRPLKEFTHLGKIPPEETQQKTLPIFDNHRVARRFSNRTQRVIKVPNSNVLRKASSHLKAKGITRIFLDGRVYSLINN